MKMLSKFAVAFVKDEEGAALTEYLVLIGLITAAAVAATILFGNTLANTFNDWSTWIGTNLNAPT